MDLERSVICAVPLLLSCVTRCQLCAAPSASPFLALAHSAHRGCELALNHNFNFVNGNVMPSAALNITLRRYSICMHKICPRTREFAHPPRLFFFFFSSIFLCSLTLRSRWPLIMVLSIPIKCSRYPALSSALARVAIHPWLRKSFAGTFSASSPRGVVLKIRC